MKTSDLKGNAIDLANSSTDFYDTFYPQIKAKCKELRTWQKILKITSLAMEI